VVQIRRGMEEDILKSIREALMNGDREAVSRLVKTAVDSGFGIKDIMDNALIAAMDVIGRKFKANEIFIPEVLISAKAMHAGIAILEPYFVKCGIKPLGRVVIGTVKGDLHDIGKNIVSMMFKGACFEIDDLGIDVSPQKFVDSARAKGADIVAMSSLLTTSMNAMKDTIKAITAAGLRDKVRVMVGGAPVTQDFADAIGADCYARDAATAVDKAKELLAKR
jgi:5-methyltetrahydrofolate--homocysteine methyltransferase